MIVESLHEDGVDVRYPDSKDELDSGWLWKAQVEDAFYVTRKGAIEAAVAGADRIMKIRVRELAKASRYLTVAKEWAVKEGGTLQ